MRIDAIIAGSAPTFSVEFSPPKTPEATEGLMETARQLAALDLDFVSVTYGAGGSTRQGTVEVTRRLKDELGLETMAHLSCVGETTEGLSATLDGIEAAGIENVFALRGDPPRGQADFAQPEGGLGSAAELAQFIGAGWDFGIGGACFPEIHPEAPDLDTDLSYLKLKVDSGASFLITQLFFDNQVYFDFVRAARAKGIEVPILAGVIPVASYAQTKRICELCDATIPARLERAFEAAGGEAEREFELGVAYAAQQCAELLIAGAPGIHFYALNRAPATRAVLGSLRASRPWERTRGDGGPPLAGAVDKETFSDRAEPV
jgi:methylenetetrahydrofolate reductase (NADPH)